MAYPSTNSAVQDLFAKLLEKRFDRQPCCAGILYECMRFLTGHYKVNAAEEFLSFGCFRTEHRLVSAYINRIINVAWCFGHGTSSRSRSWYIVSISTGPARRQLRDNAAARSIVIGGRSVLSICGARQSGAAGGADRNGTVIRDRRRSRADQILRL